MKRFLLTVLSLFLVSASFFAGKVYAVDPIPGARIPCPDIDKASSDPNFNSSRPYQASPCGDSPKAIMCGNTLQIIETYSSTEKAGATESIIDRPAGDKDYAADLTGATFPIVGNTELTTNSQNITDQIDDATKVNEYLSWYLNGVTNRAEYGSSKNTNYGIVNLSGPVQKLLPGAIQDADRIATIDYLYKSVDYASEKPQNPGDHPGPTESVHDDAITHDQIVACANIQPALGIIGGVFGLVDRAVPHECYQVNGKPSVGKTYQLSDWNGSLGIVRTFSNTAHSIVGGILNTIIGAANAVASVLNTIPGVENAANAAAGTLQNAIGATPVVGVVVNKVVIPAAAQVISNATSTAWNNRKPPLPWGINPNTGKVFTATEYQRAYNEWRGQSCLIVPIINRLVCFDNPVAASPEWSDLFPYVPLSNTVDKSAHLPITGVGINGQGGTVLTGLDDPQYFIKQEPILYYPHTAEVSELSNSLNQTYIPKEGTSNSAPSSSVDPVNDPATGKCRIIDLRSNPGDYLFPEVAPSEVRVHVNPYTVHSIPCHDETREDKFGNPYTIAVCQGSVAIEIRMKTKVPYADEIYNSTTAGADSTFRRIYPRVEAGAPVSCISNIPSVSDVQYIPKDNMNGMKVIGPLGDNTTDDAKLYFPHLGSVYDYFLKGIQTALRPQGYGEPTPVSGTACSNLQCGELPGLPKASGSCTLGNVGVSVNGSLKQIVEAAAQTYKTPASLIVGIMYGEGLFDGNNKKDWTDENVKNWATCQRVPGCNESGEDNFLGFNGTNFQKIAPHILPDLQKLDPTKTLGTLSQCNLLDAIYAEAWNLRDSADGGNGIPATCFGIPLGGSIPPLSCSWNDSNIAAAIKIAENGYDPFCFTAINSCATGGGNAARCTNGVDGCEKITNRYPGQPSHFGCIWDVAK